MIAGAPSLREIRAQAITALNVATLPFNPTISDTPVNPSDADDLPEVHVFDGGRNSTSNSQGKLYRGVAILSLGIEVTVAHKSGYADQLDELTDAVVELLLGTDSVLAGVAKVENWNTRPEYEKAETPLAKNIITVNMSTQEKFVAIDSGNPAPLEEVKTTVDTSPDETQNTTVTFKPDQPAP